MTVTAQQLDELRSKVEAKQTQVAKAQEQLEELENELRAKANEFMLECGVETEPETKKEKSSKGTARSNAKAKAVITKMIGNKRHIAIKKPEKEAIAAEAGCTIPEVEATLKKEFQPHPPGKGRKSKFGLKK
ncbi:MAG: hypothetical protein R6U98_29065 [Pirellulaceae bacterium]